MKMKSILASAVLCLSFCVGNAGADGTWTTLDYPGASGTAIFGISGNSMVGYYYDGSGKHGFLYDGTSWTALNYPGAYLTQANGIDGSKVVGFYDNGPGGSGEHGFVYDGISYTSLTYPGAPTTSTVTVSS